MKRARYFTLFVLFTCLLIPIKLAAQDTESASKDSVDVFDKLIMERITVVGTPVWMSKIPGAARYIDFRELQKQGYTDVNRILRGISGVHIQEEDGFGLRPNIGLRGAAMERSTKVNIMEDGVLIAPAPYSAPAAYYFPNVGRMNSIEVRKGSSQIKYGPNSTGGAINLITTRIPYELSGQAELSAGEYNSSKLHANFGNSHENFGYLIEGMNIRNEGFKKLDSGGNTGFNVTDLMGKLMFRTSPGADRYQRLDLKAGYYHERSNETYLGLTRQDFNEDPFQRYAGSSRDRMDADHLQLMARHFIQFSSDLDLTTTIYRNNFTRDWYKLQSADGVSISEILRNPEVHETAISYLRGTSSPDNSLSVRSNSREYYSQGADTRLNLHYDLGEMENRLELGVRFHQDQEDRFQYEDNYRMENGIMNLTTAGVPGTQANRIGSADALAIFLQNRIILDNLTINPGIRFENIWFSDQNYGTEDIHRTGSDLQENQYRVHIFIPGIGFTYDLSRNVTLITGIHKGFSPPSPGSDSNTRSEESINYELGIRYADQLIQSEIIGFYNNYNNLLGSDLAAGGGGGTTAQFNAGEVNVIGVEAALNLDFADLMDVSFQLPFSINYTLTDARFQSSFESDFGPWGTVQRGDQLPFIPLHQVSAALSMSFEKLGIHLNTFKSSRMRTIAGQGSLSEEYSTDSYFLLDLSSSYQLFTTLEIFMNIRNIMNAVYNVSDRPAGLRPGLPRTIAGGIKVNL
jgi:Fe(3+) dicitrate transport protein